MHEKIHQWMLQHQTFDIFFFKLNYCDFNLKLARETPKHTPLVKRRCMGMHLGISSMDIGMHMPKTFLCIPTFGNLEFQIVLQLWNKIWKIKACSNWALFKPWKVLKNLYPMWGLSIRKFLIQIMPNCFNFSL